MTKQHPFRLHDEDSLIILKGQLSNNEVSFALDTGASHTVIDLSPLLIAGYEIKDAIGTVQMETDKGVLDAYVFKVAELSILGITRKDVEICSYDYFNNHIFPDFDGVLGLDFFREYKVCIDFRKSVITIH
jgi:hypothetical protein